MQASWSLPDPEAGAAWAAALARVLPHSFFLIALRGELGAGKTHTVRSLLRELGVCGTVRSPTYTLLEMYEVAGRQLLHLDLYRLSEAEELEHLGLRDFLAQNVQMLVEWSQRGDGVLPKADLEIELVINPEGGRLARATAGSALGESCLRNWQQESL